MQKTTFWTQRRFAGFTLMIGCCLFLTAAGMIPRDAQGNYSILMPPRAALLIIAQQMTLAQWDTSLFICGVTITALGFAQLTELLWESKGRVFSHLGLLSALFGAVMVVIALAFSLGVDTLAAQETARMGVVPDYYVPLTGWTNALFQIYTVAAFLSLMLYGGALFVSRILPRWLSWTAMIYGLAGLGLFAYAQDMPPFVHYLLPMLMGILLLLRGNQTPQHHHTEVETMPAEPPASKGTR